MSFLIENILGKKHCDVKSTHDLNENEHFHESRNFFEKCHYVFGAWNNSTLNEFYGNYRKDFGQTFTIPTWSSMPNDQRRTLGFIPSVPIQFGCNVNRRKGGQVRFTTAQTATLERKFIEHKYLSSEDRKVLANGLNLSDRQVKTWFQNRRAKWRRASGTSAIEEFERRVAGNDVTHEKNGGHFVGGHVTRANVIRRISNENFY